MKSLLAMFRAPHIERIEQAVKTMAERRADVAYHLYMRDYYYDERTKITPQTSAANANEYARLFVKQEDHEAEGTTATRKFNAATAKVEALRKAQRA